MDAQQDVRDELGALIDLLDRDEDAWAVNRRLEGLLDHQQALEERTGVLSPKTLGRRRDQLGEGEIRELDEIAQQQRMLREEAGGLVDEMRRRADRLEEVDPETASAMRAAADAAEQGRLQADMDDAARGVERNQLSQAATAQQSAAATLARMIDRMSETKRARAEQLLRQLPALAALGREVGITGCATWLSPQSDSMTFRDNFHWHVDRLRPVAEILAEEGLSLGLEFVGPRTSRADARYGFIYAMDGVLGLAECIGVGNVGLLLDSWHWYTTLGTAADIMSLGAADVVHVHINDAPAGIPPGEQRDNVRRLPGETGVIDLTTFLTCLNKIGYTGAVSPEPFSSRLAELSSAGAAQTVGESLGRVWSQAGLA